MTIPRNNDPSWQETTAETIASTPVLNLLTSKVLCKRTSTEKLMSQVRSGAINHGLVLNGLMFYFMFSKKDIFR
ncbi:MAG: hypothetical protein GY702_27035 [Desulfobulbaceae bacterium]|nr:hypothetical protein [Desulfobulbaceae bacterium]